MADSKISALTSLTGASVDTSVDVMPIVDDSATTTKKITVAQLAIAINATSAWSTGDVKLTLKTTADSGWVLMDDKTIGDASSGATGRANADTSDLFTLLWNNTADAECAVSTGRGANAAADYAAHKTIALPKALGRALATYGEGSGLTSRVLALAYGDENLASHTHTGPSHTHTIPLSDGTGGATTNAVVSPNTTTTATATSGASGTGNTGSSGTGSAGNMQPTLFLNTMIKL